MPIEIDRLGAPSRHVRAGRARSKPLLAYFSPLPPQPSGISDYSISLLAELRRHYSIDVYHDQGYVPDLALACGAPRCYDHRLFERRARVLRYHGILYQMGNSHYHGFVYDRLLTHPGVVTLHDLYLGGFHVWHSRRPGVAPDHLEAEIACERGDLGNTPHGPLPPRDASPERLQAWLREQGVWLHRRILERASGVVVHSEWSWQRAAALSPAHAGKMTVIPHGAAVGKVSAAGRGAVRKRFGLPAETLLVGCFGILHPTKLNAEAVAAFARLAAACPSALLLFVGQDFGGGEVQAKVAELGLGERVRFFGRSSAEEFQGLIEAVDLGVNLRRPPTNGENSGALLRLLGAGVATIVTDVDTFSCFPDDVAHKVPYGADFVHALGRALLDLGLDPARRARLGNAARRHLDERHRWDRVAAQYAQFIDRCSRLREGAA